MSVESIATLPHPGRVRSTRVARRDEGVGFIRCQQRRTFEPRCRKSLARAVDRRCVSNAPRTDPRSRRSSSSMPERVVRFDRVVGDEPPRRDRHLIDEIPTTRDRISRAVNTRHADAIPQNVGADQSNHAVIHQTRAATHP